MSLLPVDYQSSLTAVDFDPFADGELLLTAPATESQKEIWASVQMGDAANCAYNESQSLRLKGELDVKVFQSAVEKLVQRHEALRTTFSTDGNTLCIVASRQIEIPIIDLSSSEPQEQQEKLASILRQEVEQPFDLEHGPLFRAKIVKLQAQEHLATLTAHHIICDGWSWAVLMPDLGKLYSGLQQGIVPELEEPDNLSEYAILQEEEADSPEAIATEKYWLEQFADSLPVLDFPSDRPRPPLRTFNAAREDWHLSPELVANLKQLGTKLGCSFMTTLLGGFEVWLHRLTGQNDLVVGIPAAGQAALGQYNLVGHCVNLLPLRSQINGEQSFSDYLRSRRSAVLDAYDHQQFTFGSLVKKLVLPRDSSRIPLVPITFNIDQGLDSDKLPFTGLEVEFFSNPRSFENFELFINATELHGQMTLECQYNTNLFDADTIRHRMTEFETLLLGIVANPNQSIAKLPILPAVEQQLLATWNQTQTDYPQHKCIHQLFEEQVERTPDAVALVFQEQQLTYRELNIRANQLAQYLQTLGVGADVLVGICVDRSLEMVVGVLGILKAGGAYVPLDPGYPQERLAFMLSDTQIKLLLTQKQLIDKLPTHTAKVICLDTDWDTINQTTPENLISNVKTDNLAYVMYTSGSTGQPKGVSVIHQGVVRLVKETDYVSLTTKEVFLQISPISFDASTFEIWGCLLNGGKLIIFPPHTPSLDELGQFIQQYQVTTLWLTAGLFHLIVDEKIDALKPLRQLLAGGDVLSVTHVQKFLNTVENCRLINGYGPTESTTFTCCYDIKAPLKPGASIPIGRPIANTQVYILDSHLQPVPIGITGELYIGGDGLAREYFNRPDLTAERFIANPFSPDSQSRLYKSGDLARYLPDGKIEYLGRIDNQVKVSGFRIELGEIEIALLQYPAVKEAVVIVREDAPGEKVLVGYFVAETGQDSPQIISELRRFLKQQLPEYMVPKIFMALEALPLNANGKVDRRALPKPDSLRPELEANYVAPRTPIEQQIADIWTQVLNVRQVGIYDNFFELGGYSLLGIQVVSRLRQALQVEILMSNLFELPTVADLAERVETLRWATQGVQAADSETADDYEEGEL
ncbi:non-ribosomal peptide synthetase [Nostoc punctiforme]|uniref:Amino acid adenylation domain protein n=1 Tax=Nostoc punctiforme (strain ATCC 29133 / PCC 73102) TaxID=63737 RepID=B2J0F6_NOSP7|nr:non-ribosomal peptide synthetase [Nostoc punctiforme]ACC84846.1 amino acid adenylation domain protein [Nostoc punctiforme PCC 73102]